MLVDPAFGLQSLGSVARALSVSTPLNPLLETAAEEALLALRAATVSIGRLEHDGRSLRTLINVGDLAQSEVRWPTDETYSLEQWQPLSQVLVEGTTRTDHLGADDCDPMEADLLVALGKGSSVTAAIRVDGTVWGEFYATRYVGDAPFTDAAVDYVDVLTAIMGAAISRSMREAKLEHLAFHDPLTGALNRRGWQQAAAQVFDLPEQTSRVVTIVALDINGLKQVNDQQGHARGDELIDVVARALQETFASYPGNVVARVGGDEFTVLVPHHEPALVARAVEAFCQRANDGWSFGPVAGVSAGVASTLLTGGDDVTMANLWAAADRALYLAKKDPRSSAVVSEEYALSQRGRRAGDRG
jgi:diguanylate cyclase (GGDEF)-like protein